MKKIVLALSGAVVFSTASFVSNAADLVAGRAAFDKFTCVSCHGADAKTSTSPEYPILAGQHKDYLKHVLHAYKRGQAGMEGASVRKNAIMGAMAAPLSNADIDNISAWLASLPSPLAVRK